jgi:hypothetical protein
MASLVTAQPEQPTVNENATDLKKNLIYGLLLKEKSLTGTFQEAIGDVIKSLEKICEPVLKHVDEFVSKDFTSDVKFIRIYEAVQVWSAINEKFALLVTSESACQQVCYDLTQIYIYCWKLMETILKQQPADVPVTDPLNLLTKPANVITSTGKKFKIRRECCICQEKNAEEFTKLPCGHQYHTTCLKQWGITKSCPLCRSEVSENFRRRHVVALNQKWNLGLNFDEIIDQSMNIIQGGIQFANNVATVSIVETAVFATAAEDEAAWRAVWGTEYNNFQRHELLYYNSVNFLMDRLYIDEFSYDWKTRTVDFNDGTAQFSLNVVELQELEQWNMLLWDHLLEIGSVVETDFIWYEPVLDAIKHETRIQEVYAVHRFIVDGHLDSEEGDIIDILYDAEERTLSLYLQLPGPTVENDATNFTEHNYEWEELISRYGFSDYLEGWHEGIPGRVNELRSFDLS